MDLVVVAHLEETVEIVKEVIEGATRAKARRETHRVDLRHPLVVVSDAASVAGVELVLRAKQACRQGRLEQPGYINVLV